MVFTAVRLSCLIICPSLMMVKTSEGKVKQIYKELIRRIIKFEYEKLLLLKSLQNIVIYRDIKYYND